MIEVQCTFDKTIISELCFLTKIEENKRIIDTSAKFELYYKCPNINNTKCTGDWIKLCNSTTTTVINFDDWKKCRNNNLDTCSFIDGSTDGIDCTNFNDCLMVTFDYNNNTIIIIGEKPSFGDVGDTTLLMKARVTDITNNVFDSCTHSIELNSTVPALDGTPTFISKSGNSCKKKGGDTLNTYATSGDKIQLSFKGFQNLNPNKNKITLYYPSSDNKYATINTDSITTSDDNITFTTEWTVPASSFSC